MKITFLTQNPDNDRLILIFSGWSTSPEFYNHINRRHWDVAVVTDYTSLHLPPLPDRYRTVYLYAWSFGVAVAHHTLPADCITEAFAIAGTPQGIHPTAGIPPHIFLATKETLSLPSLRKFHNRIFTHSLSPREKTKISERLPDNPDINALRRELEKIADITATPSGKPTFRWKRAYIPTDDLIFPSEAQKEGWSRQMYPPETVELDCGHYIDIQTIVEQTIPETDAVGAHFARSQASYGEEASAQARIAKRLARRLQETMANTPYIPGTCSQSSCELSMLEIGSGNGLFSRQLAEVLPADYTSATMIDLYMPATPYRLFHKEQYLARDAEKWLEELRDVHYDIIASGSALQWFVNPERFFVNASRLLHSGGCLAVSAFVEGNLPQLDAVRPAPLTYHTPEQLVEMASSRFPGLSWEVMKIDLRFPSAREALLHLRDTGVTAGPPVPLASLLRALRPDPSTGLTTLTYRSLLITALRP